MVVDGEGRAGNEAGDPEPPVDVSLIPESTPTAVAKRHRLREDEQWLLDEERRLRERGVHAVDLVKASSAGIFWSRLNAVDFMNSSLQFAALAVLCLFPFLMTVTAYGGGDARHALVTRLGLDHKAARDLMELMSSGRHAVTDLSVFGAILVLLGALGIASTLQLWYQRVFDHPPAPKWTRSSLTGCCGSLAWLAI